MQLLRFAALVVKAPGEMVVIVFAKQANRAALVGAVGIEQNALLLVVALAVSLRILLGMKAACWRIFLQISTAQVAHINIGHDARRRAVPMPAPSKRQTFKRKRNIVCFKRS